MGTNRSPEARALVRAAKMICELKSGLCPLRERDFTGCPHACTEDIRPWQCWVAHLTARAMAEEPAEETQKRQVLGLVA